MKIQNNALHKEIIRLLVIMSQVLDDKLIKKLFNDNLSNSFFVDLLIDISSKHLKNKKHIKFW